MTIPMSNTSGAHGRTPRAMSPNNVWRNRLIVGTKDTGFKCHFVIMCSSFMGCTKIHLARIRSRTWVVRVFNVLMRLAIALTRTHIYTYTQHDAITPTRSSSQTPTVLMCRTFCRTFFLRRIGPKSTKIFSLSVPREMMVTMAIVGGWVLIMVRWALVLFNLGPFPLSHRLTKASTTTTTTIS